MRNQKLLVVGAGPVGLGMADALKRAGMAYDQVEAGSGVGGNWRHGVYDAVHTVSSKHSTAYADYPMPETYPDFPSGREMLTYLQAYARDRDLMGQIEFDRQVVAVSPNADDSWSVRFQDGEARTYKGVVICNGHHWDPIEPELPSGFSGRVMHAKSYRGPSDIAGQRVLVIGGGNSGCDIASECARSAATAD